ncbi:MAG: hypothetical protein SOT91_04580 [Bacilli bacterium]|nr:hypothetical protein [Bacilli bacterium]
MSKKIKKLLNNKYFIVALVALLIVLVIGTGTYAWLTWSSPNTTKLTVKIGNIADVIFDNGKEINTTSLAPVFTYDQGEKTSFSIVKRSTATSANIDYTITLNITSIAAELKVASFKYVLLNGNQVVRQGDFSSASSGSAISLSSSRLTDTRADFTFYIYIDGNTENNANMMNKEFKATINVSASEGSNTINAVQYITNLYTNASKTPATNNGKEYNTAPSVSLMNDRLGGTTTDLDGGNIRYYGANPNNYIYFNCSDYSNQTSSTCETWRIIGVFDGKLKLIRNESIGNYSWDNKNTSTGAETDYGKNDWTTARLMKLLNPSDYYKVDSNDNNLGQSLYYNSAPGKCYSGENNATVNCDFTSTGIKNTTRNMIAETTWNIGGWNINSVYPNQIYEYERGTTGYTGRPTTPWTGKIALAYPSDYGYAADLNQCKDKTLYDYNNSTCTSNNWMKAIITNNGWLLTPDSGGSDSVWNVTWSGYVDNFYDAYYAYGAVPVLSLSSELGIESGDGSSSNPYKLSA